MCFFVNICKLFFYNFRINIMLKNFYVLFSKSVPKYNFAYFLEISFILCYYISSLLIEVFMMSDDNKKDIEIVSGNGENLDISPVYDNLDIAKPDEDSTPKKNIIIPEVKK